MPPRNQVQRFYLLDILRGFASFVIIIWHYQHFFFDHFELAHDFNRAKQPGYIVLWPFYEYGDLAVYLFFILSGFIFFYVYSEGIASRSVSSKTFVWNRFSRLYPLHLATLLLTALLQISYHGLFDSYFVYEYNDLKHFVLQLGFISFWGLQDGHSFNGPIWSVSVEVLLYVIFFIFCRFIPIRPVFLIIMSLLGLVIGGIYIGAGLFCFFLGGLLYQLFEYQRRNPGSVFGHKLIPVLGLCLAAIAFYASTFILSRYLQIFFACVSILPATVYFLACFQDRFPNRGRSWILIGDLTYATYLLHFPLQILFQIAFVSYGRLNPFHTETLILYILATYAISYIAYRGFELPAKNFFRNSLRT